MGAQSCNNVSDRAVTLMQKSVSAMGKESLVKFRVKLQIPAKFVVSQRMSHIFADAR